MTNYIVTVNTSVQEAPAPSQLQKTGAALSQGGTTLAAGTMALITQVSDMTAILTPAAANTSLTWASSTVTVTTAAPHGIPTGTTLNVLIAGVTPNGYNGNFAVTYASATTFTYALASNPGAETVPGTWQPQTAQQLSQMATTYFAQNTGNPFYVLELGLLSVSNAVAALITFIGASPQFFYKYLVPRGWAGNNAFQALVASYTAPGAQTYFHITVTSNNYTSFLNQKSAICCIEAPGNPVTEFTAAARFALELATSPGSASPVAPMAFRYVYDVTPYPTMGNAALLITLQTANVDYIGTGSQGGIAYTILFWGNNMDGNPFNYWYAADWAAINLSLDLANAVINGPNNALNRLYYNQAGINTLQAVAQETLDNGATFGLFLSSADNPIVVNAVSFTTYTQENPSAYATGVYNGLSATAVPLRGFVSITFYLQISNFG